MSNNLGSFHHANVDRDICVDWNPWLPSTEWPTDVFSNDRDAEDRIRAQMLIARTPMGVLKQRVAPGPYIFDISSGSSDVPTPLYFGSPDSYQSIVSTSEKTAQQQLIETITSLSQCATYLHLKIADRLISLYRDAIAEDETVLPSSIRQLGVFFLANRDVGLPKITLTPNHTLRARWIHGIGDFAAIEFTGTPIVKLVAEIPRTGGSIAHYFGGEPIETVAQFARALGVVFS